MDKTSKIIKASDLPDALHERFLKKMEEFENYLYHENIIDVDIAISAMAAVLGIAASNNFENPYKFIWRIFGLAVANVDSLQTDDKNE